MTGDEIGRAALYGVMIVLPLSALAARRMAWRQGVLAAIAWVAIFGVVLLGFAERYRFAAIGRDLHRAIDPEAGEQHGSTVRVPMAEDGHFWVRATVNGAPVRFLVDSGATTVALGTSTAARVGVAADTGYGGGFGVPLSTANGSVVAQRATIARLNVAGIERRGLSAVVAPEFGDTNVLGMNFLSSLNRWGVEGRTLVLVP